MEQEPGQESTEQQTPEVQEAPAEVKSVDQMTDEFFAEKPQDSSPENTQPDESKDSGSEPPKTPESEDKTAKESDDFKDIPEGFSNHPAWQKIIKQKQDALNQLKEKESDSSQYKELLADPVIYRRYLEKEGYSENKINSMMKEAGHPVSMPGELETKQDIVSEICKQEGWDENSLDDNQKAQIKDLFGAVDRRTQRLIDNTLKNRVGPIEDKFQESDRQAKFKTSYDEAVTKAKEEFPDLDWYHCCDCT